MNFRELNINHWQSLNTTGTTVSGYQGIWLGLESNSESDLHIFRDESGHYHFAIEVENSSEKLVDPQVNGLAINFSKYSLGTGDNQKFIDIKCNINSFLPEFTMVTKEICVEILINQNDPVISVNRIIQKWITFWNNRNSQILSVEEQIGLLCELSVLKKLISINPMKALESWVGPLRQRHDFILNNISIEVKGTTRASRIHTINGVDQLLSYPGKDLLFISFLVANSNQNGSISLPNLINEVYELLNDNPALIVQFSEFLAKVGYSPVHSIDYEAFGFLVTSPLCYWVDLNFPYLSSSCISTPLISRISSIRYDISLEGLKGVPIAEMDWAGLMVEKSY